MFGTSLSLLQTLLGKRFLNLIFLFVLIGLGSTATTFDTKVSGQSVTQSCPTCRPPTLQVIYAPIIGLPETSRSEIVLNSRSPQPIDVTPTFYTLEGVPITGQAIRLQPAEMRFVNVLSLIPEEHRNQHSWGGMSLSYTGKFMEAWAQLTLYGIGNRNSVDVLFNVMDAPRSNVREAVWRMPFNGVAAIVMGNYSETATDGDFDFFKRRHAAV